VRFERSTIVCTRTAARSNDQRATISFDPQQPDMAGRIKAASLAAVCLLLLATFPSIGAY